MIRIRAVVSLMSLVVALPLTGCTAETTEPPRDATTTTTTTTKAPEKRTLADLAEKPCAVLDDADKIDLGVATTTEGGDPGQCSWVAVNGGFVVFKPYPTTDETAARASLPGVSAFDIAGHGAVQVLQETTCVLWVTMVVGESSFLVSATDDDPSISCPGTTEFAKVIVANLR